MSFGRALPLFLTGTLALSGCGERTQSPCSCERADGDGGDTGPSGNSGDTGPSGNNDDDAGETCTYLYADGRFGLRFDTPDFPGERGTIEWWMAGTSTGAGDNTALYFQAVQSGESSPSTLSMYHYASTQTVNSSFIYSDGYPASLTSNDNLLDDSWHHVAFAWDLTIQQATLWLWIDGVLTQTWTGERGRTGAVSIRWGSPGESEDGPRFSGFLSDIRVSRAIEYSGDFSPAANLEQTPNTVHFFPLSEGGGTTTADTVTGSSTELSGLLWQDALCR